MLRPVCSDDQPYIPPTKPYELSNLVKDLVVLARYLLKPGGRLVFFLPTVTDEYQEVDIHNMICEGMQVIANSLQDFGFWGRRVRFPTYIVLVPSSYCDSSSPYKRKQWKSVFHLASQLLQIPRRGIYQHTEISEKNISRVSIMAEMITCRLDLLTHSLNYGNLSKWSMIDTFINSGCCRSGEHSSPRPVSKWLGTLRFKVSSNRVHLFCFDKASMYLGLHMTFLFHVWSIIDLPFK